MAPLGYARVSTDQQTTNLQRDALSAAGCIRIWEDTASGSTTSRPQLDAVLDHLREGTRWWCGGWTGWAGPCLTFWEVVNGWRPAASASDP